MSKNRVESKKIALFGDSGVGKTQVLSRWVNDSFNDQYTATIGMDFKTKTIKQSLKFQIWDTAGQERYRTLIPTYFKGTHVFILVFSVTDQESFTNLQQHLATARPHISAETPIILLANKIDDIDNRTVTKEAAEQFAGENALHYYEISAKNSFNVEVFEASLLRLSPIQQKPLPINTELQQKINKFKTDNPNNKEIQAICAILEGVIKSSQDKSLATFDNHAPRLKQHLDPLRWNFKSIINSVMNLIATVFGLPFAYCCSWFEANKKATGDSLMFFKFGEHQASKVLCNEVFAEIAPRMQPI
ncbi:MAG: Rab family GTPase [Gammaproteobacteria bacterium]